MSKRRLGRGIDALLQGRDLEQLSRMTSILMVDVGNLHPNPSQPRKRFDPATLEELAASIREKGVIQPVIAEDRGDGHYTIVAGERRVRAAKLAGLAQVPVISQDFSDEEKLEIALVENLQREDLNALEEARAMQSAIEQAGITQEQLAGRLGRSRSAVANSLRLLRLEPTMQEGLASGRISAGHARALLSVTDPGERARLFDRIVEDELSVREAEAVARGEPVRVPRAVAGGDTGPGGGSSSGRPTDSRSRDAATLGGGDDLVMPEVDREESEKSVELRRIEEELIGHLGTRVVIRGSDSRGRIEITYLSTDDLERVVEAMGARLPG